MLVPIRDERGLTVWIEQAPERCPEGHTWTLGDVGSYHENWYACWCAGARSRREGRPGNHTFTCAICNAQITDPPCVDPTQLPGYGP
jgi:hypothetical protein